MQGLQSVDCRWTEASDAELGERNLAYLALGKAFFAAPCHCSCRMEEIQAQLVQLNDRARVGGCTAAGHPLWGGSLASAARCCLLRPSPTTSKLAVAHPVLLPCLLGTWNAGPRSQPGICGKVGGHGRCRPPGAAAAPAG